MLTPIHRLFSVPTVPDLCTQHLHPKETEPRESLQQSPGRPGSPVSSLHSANHLEEPDGSSVTYQAFREGLAAVRALLQMPEDVEHAPPVAPCSPHSCQEQRAGLSQAEGAMVQPEALADTRESMNEELEALVAARIEPGRLWMRWSTIVGVCAA